MRGVGCILKAELCGRQMSVSGHNQTNEKYLDETRVTRLVEFSPIGWLLSLGNFKKITEVAKHFCYFFPRCNLCTNFDKKLLGYISGHPGWNPILQLLTETVDHVRISKWLLKARVRIPPGFWGKHNNAWYALFLCLNEKWRHWPQIKNGSAKLVNFHRRSSINRN
jgi:hypothetical protein